ncbi:hypothetical protein RMATCC62417_17570 [Rhizopus microsporus]|nr:hypothetical protein RMATCC62417_17570 [Rhizopus microsporus]
MTEKSKVKVAVIGSGLAGLSVAYLLTKGSDKFEVHLFEKNASLGMDASSISVGPNKEHRIDVPMRSFMSGYYSHLLRLYNHLQIPAKKAKFSFGWYKIQQDTTQQYAPTEVASFTKNEPYLIYSGARTVGYLNWIQRNTHSLMDSVQVLVTFRKNLSRSMRDLSQATGKLDIILVIVFTIVWVIIVCAAFGVNVGTDLMPLWSAFVAASFIFGTSAKDAFEAIIFVFITHPFDVGDRVLIGTESWMVHEVGLLVTTFLKWDGSVVYAKNSVLSTQYIINVRRSGRTGETNELQIHFNTPTWKIKKLISHMQEWCNQFPKHYSPNSASCNILSFQNQNLISLSFYFEHAQNWQDPGGRWLRHNNFMFELKEECERLGIEYTLPTQPLENRTLDAPLESYNFKFY